MSGQADRQPTPSLGHSTLADQLASRIDRHFAPTTARSGAHLTVEQSLVIGVFGEWGAGKSTLLAEIGARYKGRIYPTTSSSLDLVNITIPVEFNAWRYEREPELIVPLLHTIDQAVSRASGQYQSLVAARQPASSGASKVVKALGAVSRFVAVAGLSLASSVKVRADLPGFGAVELSPKDAIAEAKNLLDAPIQKPTTAMAGKRRQLATELSSVYYDFQRRLMEITGRAADRADDPQINLLILVDDIDRCLPEKAVEMLETAKLFLDVPGCAFVLAIDDEVVERGILHRYRDYLFAQRVHHDTARESHANRRGPGDERETAGRWETTAVLEGHTDWVTSVAVLGDGRLVSGGADGLLRVWRETAGRWDLADALEGHTNSVTSVAVLGDGRLASGGADNVVRIWRESSGRWELADTLGGHTSSVMSVAVLGVGRIVSCGADGVVRVWRETGNHWQTADTFQGHTVSLLSVAVLGDRRLASCGWDTVVRVWSETAGRWEPEAALEGHTDWVTSLAVLADGRLASGGYDHTVRVWRKVAGQWELAASIEGHTNSVTSVAVLSEGRLVSGGTDAVVRVWRYTALRWEPDASLEGHTDRVTSVAVLGGGRLVSGGADRVVRVWRESGGKWEPAGALEGHTGWVTSVAVLGERRLVSGGADHVLRVWQETVDSWHLAATLEGHIDTVTSVGVLADGRLVSGGGAADTDVRVWRETGNGWELAATLEGHTDSVRCLVALSDGRLASGGADKTVRLWRETEGGWEPADVLEGHNGAVTSLAVLSGRLISGGADNVARVWQESGGRWEPAGTLGGRSGPVVSVAVLVHRLTPRFVGVTGGDLEWCLISKTGQKNPAGVGGVYGPVSIWTSSDGTTAVTLCDPEARWRTAIVEGRRVPADERYNRYTYYVTASGRLVPAYTVPDLIEWDDPEDPRTLIMKPPLNV